MLSGPGSHGVAAVLPSRRSVEGRCILGATCKPLKLKGVEGKLDDGNPAVPDFREWKGGTYDYLEINLCLLIPCCLIFVSSVDRGIPSFAAAPSGPATFPLLSAKAASIISFS